MDTSEPIKRTRVRAYGQEFKARVVAECQQPGTSVAKVALAHGPQRQHDPHVAAGAA